MEKVLNQEEIDALVRAARSGEGGQCQVTRQPQAEPWDVRRSSQIGREQLQAITLLHEAFARNLTYSLSAYLRVGLAANLVSAEHLPYREFLQRIPEATYLASCQLNPMGVNAALQMDLKVAFPIIDLLLGGEGKSLAATREITEIEGQILDSVSQIICRDLAVAWQALSLTVEFDERLDASTARRLMGPEDKTLSLSFEITMPDVRGGMNLALPAVVSNALLRKISSDGARRRPPGIADSRQRLMRLLLDCPFQIELGAQDVTASMSLLSGLAPGQLLSFGRSAAEPASLLVAGSELFRALPARCGATRAARILERVAGAFSCASSNKEPSR